MELVWTHCNKCCGDRKHEILHSESTKWDELVEDQFSISGWDKYEMVKCGGCENVSLRHFSSFSEDCDEYGRPAVETKYYPPTISRREPSWLYKLRRQDQPIHDFFKEIYISLHNECPRLATMGVRALLEHVMISKVGDNHSFINNLNEFEKAGFISKIQRAVIEPVLEAGHATMHRAFAPTIDNLVSIIDITENIVESIYINEDRVKELLEKVPPKKPKSTPA